MEKDKVVLKLAKEVKFDFQGQEIKVKPYISFENTLVLIETYTTACFQPDHKITPISAYDKIGAEFALMVGVVDVCTNLDIGEVDIDDLLSGGLWGMIVEKIVNYKDFHGLLDSVVKDIQEQIVLERSLGSIIDGIAKKVEDFIDKASTMDTSPEGLAQIRDTAKEIMDGIKDRPIANALTESQKVTKPRKTRKKSE